MSNPAVLSSTHAALVQAACLRDDRHLLPPERVRGGARRRLADKLVALGLAEAVLGEEAAWWVEPDQGPIGLRLTADIDGEPGSVATAGEGADDTLIGERTNAVAPVSHPVEPRGWTKIARVLALLRQTEGADLPTLAAATDWLPHTTRAALTGLRRKGHAIEARKREADGRTVYRIVSLSTAAPEPGTASASETACNPAEAGSTASGTRR